MSGESIAPDQFLVQINQLWLKQWFLLTSGDFVAGEFNTMTVAWGSFGIMWNKPMAMVVVRPTRHTYNFINQYPTFTLCAFSDEYKEDLNLLGTRSGRDGDKISQTRLTPTHAVKVAAPGFKEAELMVECRKMYWNDFNPANFMDKSIIKNYPQKDFHRMFFGEIITIQGMESFSAKG
jgi:flavin reductase (DIM6/NTAB) family NADH-FMN oxidoreductase RutF